MSEVYGSLMVYFLTIDRYKNPILRPNNKAVSYEMIGVIVSIISILPLKKREGKIFLRMD